MFLQSAFLCSVEHRGPLMFNVSNYGPLFRCAIAPTKKQHFSLRTALTDSGDSWLMVCVCVCVCFFLAFPTWNCHATKWLDVNCACFTSILLPPNGWPKFFLVVCVHEGIGRCTCWAKKKQEWSQIPRKGTPEEFPYSGILWKGWKFLFKLPKTSPLNRTALVTGMCGQKKIAR